MPEDLLFYTICEEDAGRKIRGILLSELGLSRALLQRLRDHNRVTLNGEPVFLTARVKTGDLIRVDIGFEEETSVTPESMPLEILFEDADFLVLNKPPGMLTHPVGREVSGTLANGVVYYWRTQGIPAKFRPIHRLDRNTSGLVVVGKNQFAHQSLYKQFHQGSVKREYLAVVSGWVFPSQGSVRVPIARKPGSIIERCVSEEGQAATTHYRVIRACEKMTMVSLSLETGRTHQIRVHMSYLGHPLLGDTLYGGSDLLIKRQALHSNSFGFLHPRSGREVCFTAPLAPDIQDLLERFDSR